MMPKMVKISELKPEDRSKLREYWRDLYGEEYAKDMVTDFETGGEMKQVAAEGNKKIKK